MPSVADVAADRRAGSAGARTHDDPFRGGVLLFAHLHVDRLGDVVVAAPVGCALRVGELVQIVAAGFLGDALRLGVHLT
ncbi:Uncharacterised protein [Mycobacterium tuberculosis]|nr:Uncharacterised protein [Mycobacterium tuberculosis]